MVHLKNKLFSSFIDQTSNTQFKTIILRHYESLKATKKNNQTAESGRRVNKLTNKQLNNNQDRANSGAKPKRAKKHAQ